ncbi:hypothetical protein PRUB_a5125 [Pseudoalteromonas rubra]|uniref:Uncharacterized protein n=1 Tax=Pseudoalteromonas rubra TaxID=43658 RepID=A0A8T0C3G0_9GAMM|nr:hypothetical protein [Pseudoalteromonas rubra]KAF7783816.1 hypothetical protein PRUB_a5125 [Pseudoalteromonas rubra]
MLKLKAKKLKNLTVKEQLALGKTQLVAGGAAQQIDTHSITQVDTTTNP